MSEKTQKGNTQERPGYWTKACSRWIFEKHAPDCFIHKSLRGQDPLLSSQAFRSRYQEIERFKADGDPGELILFKQRTR